MLFYQMSRMCREKGAVKHYDRLDTLAQGVKYFTDAMSINAHDQIKQRKRDEWNSILEDFLTSPERSANHLVMAMNKEQRDEARGLEGNSSVPTWI